MSEDLGFLEQDVDASRARLDRSLSELGRRLSPMGLTDEVLDVIGLERAESLREGMRNLVRRYPIPLLLLGSGIGLLLWEMRRQASDRDMDDDELQSFVAVEVIEEFN